LEERTINPKRKSKSIKIPKILQIRGAAGEDKVDTEWGIRWERVIRYGVLLGL
jgi:hypothetical protein